MLDEGRTTLDRREAWVKIWVLHENDPPARQENEAIMQAVKL